MRSAQSRSDVAPNARAAQADANLDQVLLKYTYIFHICVVCVYVLAQNRRVLEYQASLRELPRISFFKLLLRSRWCPCQAPPNPGTKSERGHRILLFLLSSYKAVKAVWGI